MAASAETEAAAELLLGGGLDAASFEPSGPLQQLLAKAGAATGAVAGPPAAYSSPSRRLLGSKRPRPPSPFTASVALQAPSPPPSPRPPPSATALVYDAGHTRHAHPRRKHPERPERVEAVLAHLEAKGLLGRCRLLPVPAAAAAGGVAAAPEAALAGVHSQHYLTRLRRLEGAPLEKLEAEAEGFDSVYLNEATVDCARRAAGALLALVTAVVGGSTDADDGEREAQAPAAPVRNGLALIRPPGHHAEEHHARGFCVLNNVAVAAKHARRALGVARVLIVDWDIHHGNGTQRAFLSDPSVLYFSVHRHDRGRFFPGTGSPAVVGEDPGEGFTVNVAWQEGGIGDREYRAVFRRLLLPLARAFAPELVLVSAGFDGAEGDEMGGCRITPAGFGWMTRALVEGVPSAAGRVVLALEGGYRLSVLSQCVEACVEALLVQEEEEEEEQEGVMGKKACPRLEIEEEEEEEEAQEQDEAIAPAAEEAIVRALELHRPFWPCLRE